MRELEKIQSVIGKFALQVRGSTASELVNLDLGLKPIKMIIYERKIRYFYRINKEEFLGSNYVRKCLDLHLNCGKHSSYINEMKTIANEIGIDFDKMTNLGACFEGLHKWAVSGIIKNSSSKSSLKFCSFPL